MKVSHLAPAVGWFVEHIIDGRPVVTRIAYWAIVENSDEAEVHGFGPFGPNGLIVDLHCIEEHEFQRYFHEGDESARLRDTQRLQSPM